MVATRTSQNNAKSRHEAKTLKLRAALLLRGHTIASFARKHGATRQLVQKIIHGKRPARSGRSATIRAALAGL